MSRIRPPLTTSMTSPSTFSPALNFSSTEIQPRSYSARFLDSTRRPSLSSFCKTSASSSSPSPTTSDGSMSLRMDSSREGMTPSDLKPMSSSTSSWSIFTTVPVTKSPSSNGLMVPSTKPANSSSVMSGASMMDGFLISLKVTPLDPWGRTNSRKLYVYSRACRYSSWCGLFRTQPRYCTRNAPRAARKDAHGHETRPFLDTNRAYSVVWTICVWLGQGVA